jgi:hypothetical protein
LKIVIHGSANLRTSANIEQFVVEEYKELFDQHNEYQDRIIERFSTINKTVQGKKLWHLINQEAQ